MPVVYLSLGSNLGRRKKNIDKAISCLKNEPCFRLSRVSSFYETEPEGLKSQPRFINACVKAKTSLRPRELLEVLKKIEKETGRKKRMRWGPREIDIDILFYGKKKIREDGLVIPHPRLHKRFFVLEPLSEISPGLCHPVYGATVKELLSRLKNNF